MTTAPHLILSLEQFFEKLCEDIETWTPEQKASLRQSWLAANEKWQAERLLKAPTATSQIQ